MKKLVRLSLAAAVATAGLTTTASAVSLEEAIKGVDVSGQFRFRAEEKNTDATSTDVEIEVGVKVPVNDNVTAVFKIDTTRNTNDTNTGDADYLDVEDYYFSYNNAALTVNAGQLNIPGRITDGAQGNGVVALYNLGEVTVGAAAFMNNNLSGSTTTDYRDAQLLSAMAMGNFANVSYSLQYADLASYGSTVNVKLDTKIADVNVGGEYTETDVDANSNEYYTTKVHAATKIAGIALKVAYAETGKDGSGASSAVASGDYATAAEAASESLTWQLGSATKADYAVTSIDASYALNDKVTLRAAYADGEYDVATVSTDATETLGQISYKMSKNLSTYVRYSEIEIGTNETQERARVEVAYKF